VRHWLIVAVLAWALAALVAGAVDRAEATRAHWGRTTRVWVADRSLRPGEDLVGAVRAHRWPTALVPPAAIRAAPSRGRAAGPIDAGTAITEGLLEQPRSDRRRVALPLPDVHLALEEGDRVDVWATSATVSGDDDSASPTRRIAVGARVVEADDDAVVLDLAPGQVATVAGAAATATITLVGVP
jgi:hypothetical protein